MNDNWDYNRHLKIFIYIKKSNSLKGSFGSLISTKKIKIVFTNKKSKKRCT